MLYFNGLDPSRCIRSEVGGSEFQRWGTEMRKERLDNLDLDVRGGSERQRYSDERGLPDGLSFMSLRRYLVQKNEGDYL